MGPLIIGFEVRYLNISNVKEHPSFSPHIRGDFSLVELKQKRKANPLSRVGFGK